MGAGVHMKRICLLLPLVLVLTLFLLPVVKAPAAGEGEIRYTVDLTGPDQDSIAVTLEMDATSGPVVLEMPDSYGNGLATGLSSHIEDERATDASGQALPVSRDGNTWSIEGSGMLTFTYKVRMSGYRAATGYLESLADAGTPWPFFPMLDPDLAYLPGYAIFVRPRDSQFFPSLELQMPTGWQHALSWPEQPSDMDDLLNNPLYAGKLSIQEQGSLLIAVPEAATAAAGGSLAEYGGKARVMLEKAEALLGGLNLQEGHRLALVLLFRGEGGTEEYSYYPSSPFSGSVAIPAAAENDPLSDTTIEATARGFTSLLLAEKLWVDSEALWLLEGSSWYLQDLLPYESGLWGASLFWDRFNLHYDAYRVARGEFPDAMARAGVLSLESEEGAVMLTCGGASACASFDSELRSMQPYSLDLATFLRNLSETGNAGGPLSNTDIMALLTNLTGRDWSAFFRDYIEGTEEIPASAFSSLNIADSGGTNLPLETPETDTSTSGWILIVVAVLVVFLIPFILEPYTMRPRKPGFLEKELAKDEED
jgi:hypothetical protein